MRSKHGLALLRVGISAALLTHGAPKALELFSAGAVAFPDPLGLGARTSLAFTVGAEVVCALFCFFGLFTRAAAIPIVFTLLVAAFLVHGGDGFRAQELALLYALGFLALVVGGPGTPSVDMSMRRRRMERV